MARSVHRVLRADLGKRDRQAQLGPTVPRALRGQQDLRVRLAHKARQVFPAPTVNVVPLAFKGQQDLKARWVQRVPTVLRGQQVLRGQPA
jgi:hypothetical protein